MSYRIAIIEDDNKISNRLKNYIESFDYEVFIVDDFKNIDSLVLKINPNLILLDINLPYYNGFYWTKKIRQNSKVPIIIISARDSSMDVVMALENGADDYLNKPIDNDILLAKINSQLRRGFGDYSNNQKELSISGLVLNQDKLILTHGEKQAFLSVKELNLIKYLMEKNGKVVRREILLEKVWDDENFVDGNTLNVNITRIRKKLEDLGLPDSLKTVRGMGYILDL